MSRKLHFATVPVSPGDRNSRDISDRSRPPTRYEPTYFPTCNVIKRGEASWRRGLETPRARTTHPPATRITRFEDSNCGAVGGKNDAPTEGERG